MNEISLENHALLVSGRASFEIMQKALAARIPIVAAVSAPSTLAADFAMDSNQTLIGFLREGRMNIYTHPHRLHFPKNQECPL
jgi:FdhD protein